MTSVQTRCRENSSSAAPDTTILFRAALSHVTLRRSDFLFMLHEVRLYNPHVEFFDRLRGTSAD